MLTALDKDILAQWMLSFDVSLTSLRFDPPEDLDPFEIDSIWYEGITLVHEGKAYLVLPDQKSDTGIAVYTMSPSNHLQISDWIPSWEELARQVKQDYDGYDPTYYSSEVTKLIEKLNLH